MAIPAAGDYLFALVFGEFVIFYCRNGYIRSLRFDIFTEIYIIGVSV